MLREWDVFEDVPSDLVGKYDYVHVRLLILVTQNSDLRSIVRSLPKLLKPEGFLQWDELDCVNMCIKKYDPSLTTPALDEIYSLCYSNGKYNWSVQIANVLAEEGLWNARIDYCGDSRVMARAFNDQHMLTMDEFAMRMTKIGQKEKARNVNQLISDAFHEATEGSTLCIPRVVCIANKKG